MGAMFMAITNMGTTGAASLRPVALAERTVFYRERATGMYAALPYAFAQIVIEIPYTTAMVVIYGLIVYAMMGYEWTLAKLICNSFFMLMTILYFIYYGFMVIAISPNEATGAIMSGFFYTMWNLFAGFSIPRPRMVIWWRWYAWVCPVSWSLYGMAVSQYGDVKTKLASGETVSEFLTDYFGFRYDFLWIASFAVVAFTFLFVFVYAYATKYLNFQKR